MSKQNTDPIVTYTTESDGNVLATIAQNGVDQWPGGHYLNSDEMQLFQNDRALLDTQLIAQMPGATPPPTPITPVSTVVEDVNANITAQAQAEAASMEQAQSVEADPPSPAQPAQRIQ